MTVKQVPKKRKQTRQILLRLLPEDDAKIRTYLAKLECDLPFGAKISLQAWLTRLALFETQRSLAPRTSDAYSWVACVHGVGLGSVCAYCKQLVGVDARIVSHG